jgi:hypothetical protein
MKISSILLNLFFGLCAPSTFAQTPLDHEPEALALRALPLPESFASYIRPR